MMKYRFKDLVDIEKLQELTDEFYEATSITSAIIDVNGEILTGSGWQRICTDFHRKHPEIEKECIESDTRIRAQLDEGAAFVIYRCPRGLVDASSPIVIAGEHVANVFAGQVFLSPPDEVAEDFFRQQARKFGFDEADYVSAFKEVQVLTEEKFRASLSFLVKLAHLIADLGQKRLNELMAMEALRESEEKFSLLSEQSMLAIAIFSLKGYLYFNDAYLKLTEYSEAELYQMRVEDTARLIHPEYREFVMEQGRRKMEGTAGTIAHYVYKGITKTGKEKWVEQYSKPIKWSGQSADFMMLIDVTQRMETQQKLIKSEERFRELAELLPETIYEIDESGKIIFVNKNAYKVFLYTEDDFKVGLNGLDMIASKDRERASENLSKVLLGHNLGIQEYTAQKKDGTKFPVMMRSAPVYTNGKVSGLRGFIIDITDQKTIETKLRQAEKLQSIGTLAGGVAHDFNNILSIIMGNTELAVDDLPAGSPVGEYLEETKAASLRAKELIKQLLTFTKKSEEKQRPIKIPAIVSEALSMLRSSIPANIDIRQHMADGTYVIRADPTQIHQILINLVTNAMHSLSSDGKIDVEIKNMTIEKHRMALINDLEPGNYVLLSVKDTGSGMEPDILERIFDPYFTTKAFGKGTGMGMAVVHGLVESHNGSMEIISKKGSGTLMNIYFPECTEVPESELSEDENLPKGKETVIVVDDEKAVAMLTHKRLERLGYSVLSYADPTEVLSLFETESGKFDLLVTDMAMPRMTGEKLAIEIKKLNPDLPVILCTGYSDSINQQRAEEIGISALLMKPYSSKALADAVRRALDG